MRLVHTRALLRATTAGFILSASHAALAGSPAATAQPYQQVVLAPAGSADGPQGHQDLAHSRVTGPVIPSKDLPAAPATTLVLTREQWDQSGKFSLGDFLQTLPEQGNAANFQRNNGGINYDADGATRINLRSLGVERTLVLVDGRRMVNSGLGASTAVDLNTIPDAAVDHVEILKDRASAIYGSGAIAGVVNVVTRRGFNGTEARANFGSSTRGDAKTADFEILHGHSNDQASYLLTVSYFRQTSAYLGDRAWSSPALDYDFTSAMASVSGSSRTPQGTVRIPADFFTGLPPPGCLANSLCSSLVGLSVWRPSTRYIRDPSAPLGWRLFNSGSGLNLGDFYNFAAPSYLVTPTQRAQVFLDGDFQFGKVRAYYQGFYTWHDSKQNAAPMPLNPADYGLVVSADNLYNPFGTDLSFVGRRLVEFGPRTYREKLGTYRLVGGLEGSFGPAGSLIEWSWDVAANYGRSSGSYLTDGSFRNSRVAAAIGPSMLVGGVPRCVSIPGDASSVIPDCVPLNLFGGPGSIDQAQIDYLGFHGKTGVRDSLLGLTANVSGPLFTFPSGGKAKLAIGYEFRRESGAEIADPVMAAGDSADFNFNSTHGAQSSHEIRAELSLPLAVDMPAARLFEIDFAAAHAHYDTFGGISSFRFGAQWASASGLTFSTSYSRSYHAPSLRDLFAGSTTVFPAATDPCADLSVVPPDVAAQCIATGVPFFGTGDTGLQEPVIQGGNAHVRPEKSVMFRAGLNYQPPHIPGLAFTLDYYTIHVADVIASPSAVTILQRCYYSQDSDACGRVVRDPFSGQILYIDGTTQNDGTLIASGLDFGMHAGFRTSLGDFGLLLHGSWIARFDRIEIGVPIVHGVGNRDLGSLPRVKTNVEATWWHGPWAATLGGRYIGPLKECSNPFDPTTAQAGYCGGVNPFSRKVGANVVIDAQASFILPRWSMGKTKVAIGVNNLFDRAPPLIYSAATGNSDPELYDFIGRFAYVRLTHEFN